MQKVLRRTHLAKQQAKRKARIQAEKEHIRDRAVYRKSTAQLEAEVQSNIRNERKIRREMWDLGTLSPYPNLFSTALKETPQVPPSQLSETYGTFSVRHMTPPPKPKADRKTDHFIRTGDRVCVVRGRQHIQGKIGKVRSIDEEAEVVFIEGVNQVDVRVPAEMRNSGEERLVQTSEAPVPIADVALVYPFPDPGSGIPRDVIINMKALRKTDSYFDTYANKTLWTRTLSPQNVSIPWPEEKESEGQDEEGDTLRISVEERTFLPTLLRPPMPLGVIDELRNKFSKFRDRHDDDFVARKTAEDDIAAFEKARTAALLPKGARNIARLGNGRMSPDSSFPREPQLRDEDLEEIGRAMAKSSIAA